MKILCISIFVLALIGINAHAQKRTFLRLYTAAGNKFKKGYFVRTTDTSISIYRHNDTMEVLAVNIGFIKTKRSTGHDILTGALIGVMPSTVIGIALGKPNKSDEIFNITPAEGALAGLMIGGLVGTAGGAINASVKKVTTFIINGDLNTWALQRKQIDLLPTNKY